MVSLRIAMPFEELPSAPAGQAHIYICVPGHLNFKQNNQHLELSIFFAVGRFFMLQATLKTTHSSVFRMRVECFVSGCCSLPERHLFCTFVPVGSRPSASEGKNVHSEDSFHRWYETTAATSPKRSL